MRSDALKSVRVYLLCDTAPNRDGASHHTCYLTSDWTEMVYQKMLDWFGTLHLTESDWTEFSPLDGIILNWDRVSYDVKPGREEASNVARVDSGHVSLAD